MQTTGLNALRAGIHIDAFWPAVALADLGRMLRACKTLRAECNLAFAVATMADANRKIQKVWARRWLGLAYHWLTGIKANDLTLVLALKIAQQHGGLAANYKRGIELQNKETNAMTPGKRAKLAAIEKRKRFLRDNRVLLEQKARELNEWLVAAGVPSGHFDPEIPLLDEPIDAALIVRMKARYDRSEAASCDPPLPERKAALDALLEASAALFCLSGSYYHYCVSTSKAPVDGKMVDELCFRAQVRHNVGYDDVLERLVAERGHFYAGIHAETRALFTEML